MGSQAHVDGIRALRHLQAQKDLLERLVKEAEAIYTGKSLLTDWSTTRDDLLDLASDARRLALGIEPAMEARLFAKMQEGEQNSTPRSERNR